MHYSVTPHTLPLARSSKTGKAILPARRRAGLVVSRTSFGEHSGKPARRQPPTAGVNAESPPGSFSSLVRHQLRFAGDDDAAGSSFLVVSTTTPEN